MPYALKLSPETQRSLRAYIRNADPEIWSELARLIEAEMDRFASLPVAERKNWAPGVPLHRFHLRTGDGVGRYLQFTYRYAEDEASIWITSFGLVPL